MRGHYKMRNYLVSELLQINFEFVSTVIEFRAIHELLSSASESLSTVIEFRAIHELLSSASESLSTIIEFRAIHNLLTPAPVLLPIRPENLKNFFIFILTQP